MTNRTGVTGGGGIFKTLPSTSKKCKNAKTSRVMIIFLLLELG